MNMSFSHLCVVIVLSAKFI